MIVIGPNTMGLLMAAVADKLPELPREKEVKDDTGESVDEVEKKEQHKVIDLQRKEN